MKQLPKFQEMKDQIVMTITGEGLRIEMLEKEGGMFFESGNANPSESGKELLASLAGEIGKLPNQLVIEGHTDAKPFLSRAGYSNWELSADRANSARRLMEGAGLRVNQVVQVRGFADQNLRKPEDPQNPSNRRISVIIKYQTDPAGKGASAGEERKGSAGKQEGGAGETGAKEGRASAAPGEKNPKPEAAVRKGH
jgi:chemotaxis protein MotB